MTPLEWAMHMTYMPVIVIPRTEETILFWLEEHAGGELP